MLNMPAASYSKLMVSLVNDLLKFQMAILQIYFYFFAEKKVRILCIAKVFIFFQQKVTVYLLLKSIYS